MVTFSRAILIRATRLIGAAKALATALVIVPVAFPGAVVHID